MQGAASNSRWGRPPHAVGGVICNDRPRRTGKVGGPIRSRFFGNNKKTNTKTDGVTRRAVADIAHEVVELPHPIGDIAAIGEILDVDLLVGVQIKKGKPAYAHRPGPRNRRGGRR